MQVLTWSDTFELALPAMRPGESVTISARVSEDVT